MRTRRSPRNQERLWRLLGGEPTPTARRVSRRKPAAAPEPAQAPLPAPLAGEPASFGEAIAALRALHHRDLWHGGGPCDCAPFDLRRASADLLARYNIIL